MKNVKTNNTFFFNPLYILYGDDLDYIDILKNFDRKMSYFTYQIHDSDFDPFDFDLRQMEIRISNEEESQILNHPSAKRLREQFAKNENLDGFLHPYLRENVETLPIALITFVLSLLIATNKSLREQFYEYAKGKKIPAITQWCLNTFTISPISPTATVNSFTLLDDEYRATLCCCGLGDTFADIRSLPYRDKEIALWFSLLEENFNSYEQSYLPHVDFNIVGQISSFKNYLCGLTVDESGTLSCSEDAYFHELQADEKAVYKMLANVLDAVSIPENIVLPFPHKNLYTRVFNADENTVKLIDFIVEHCVNFLSC